MLTCSRRSFRRSARTRSPWSSTSRTAHRPVLPTSRWHTSSRRRLAALNGVTGVRSYVTVDPDLDPGVVPDAVRTAQDLAARHSAGPAHHPDRLEHRGPRRRQSVLRHQRPGAQPRTRHPLHRLGAGRNGSGHRRHRLRHRPRQLHDRPHATRDRVRADHHADRAHRAAPFARPAVQGGADERAVVERRLRGAGVDLRPGTPLVHSRVHRRPARSDHPRAAVLRRLRAVDGLRGVPAHPHAGGLGSHRRQPNRGRRRPRAQRPPRHRSRGDHGVRVPRVRARQRGHHQVDRRRHGSRGDRRRHAGSRTRRARGDAPARRLPTGGRPRWLRRREPEPREIAPAA